MGVSQQQFQRQGNRLTPVPPPGLIQALNVKETRSQPSRALTTEDHVRIRRSPSQALAVILAVI